MKAEERTSLPLQGIDRRFRNSPGLVLSVEIPIRYSTPAVREELLYSLTKTGVYIDSAVDWNVRGSNPGSGKRFFFSKISRPALKTSQPPMQCVLGLRSAFFRDLTQRRLVVPYRRFGTTVV